MVKKYRVMLLIGNQLNLPSVLRREGDKDFPGFEEYYESDDDAERAIFRALKALEPTNLEFVILPVYWRGS